MIVELAGLSTLFYSILFYSILFYFSLFIKPNTYSIISQWFW